MFTLSVAHRLWLHAVYVFQLFIDELKWMSDDDMNQPRKTCVTALQLYKATESLREVVGQSRTV